jgi:hypothetical protein
MAKDSPQAVSFRAELKLAPGKDALGFVVPPEAIETLGHGARPPVRVRIGDYEFRYTVGVMNGDAMIGLSKAVRKETGVAPGDEVDVELVVDTSPRTVDVPDDFAEAMAGTGTRAFFDGLSNSLQRYHVDSIEGAKADDTRRRRIDKAVGLFAEGKQR